MAFSIYTAAASGDCCGDPDLHSIYMKSLFVGYYIIKLPHKSIISVSPECFVFIFIIREILPQETAVVKKQKI